MNIGLVRKIDYFIGIPLCSALTMLHYLNPFNRKPSNNPKKFLFIELSEMGSSILAYPAISEIKRKYDGAEMFFMIFKRNRASVDILKIIDNDKVIIVDDSSLPAFFVSVFRAISRLRREKIDVAFDLELFARSTAILTYLSGAPKRIGFYKYRMEGLYRGDLFTHHIQYNFQQHISKSFLSLVRVLDLEQKRQPSIGFKISGSETKPAVYYSNDRAVQNIWQKLKNNNPDVSPDKKLIIFNIGGGEITIRAWSLDKYVELAKRLLAHDENKFIIVTSGKSDSSVCKKFCQLVNNDRCLDLIEKTTFSELIDLYNISDAIITNDSGPAHFASLTPIRIFVFFGPETPTLYAPLSSNLRVFYANSPCSPCLTAFNHRNTPCTNNKCLQSITVDKVYQDMVGDLDVK